MEETLKLNDGTKLGGHALLSDGTLWIYLDSSTMADAFPLLNDPEKTKRITETRWGEKTVFTGYSHLFCIREESEGMLSAGLRKG